jgi:hypothetical protein
MMTDENEKVVFFWRTRGERGGPLLRKKLNLIISILLFGLRARLPVPVQTLCGVNSSKILAAYYYLECVKSGRQAALSKDLVEPHSHSDSKGITGSLATGCADVASMWSAKSMPSDQGQAILPCLDVPKRTKGRTKAR